MTDTAVGIPVLQRMFALDLRSVALFRVGLAVTVLLDLAFRAADMQAFYTDAGLLPVAVLRSGLGVEMISLHALSGGMALQIALFLVTAIAAFSMLLGYRSQLSAFVCWAMMLSLHVRNPLLQQGGDDLLVILLFFACVLPIGARFAFDAALTPTLRAEPNPVVGVSDHRWFSGIAVAATLQVLYLYVFTALLKDGSSWHADADAAWYAVHLEDYARSAGVALRDWPTLLSFGTHCVWWVELLAPLLVLSPFFSSQCRLIGLLLLASLHLSFALFLRIGLFPLIDFAALSLLLPSSFWTALARTTRAKKRAAVTLWYDGDCAFCLKMCLVLRSFHLPVTVPIIKAQSREDVFAVMQRENTWVVEDGEGRLFRHGAGLRVLMRMSAWAWPFSLAFDRSWLAARLDSVYRFVAENRGMMGRLTSVVLPWRAQALQPTQAAEWVTAVLLLAITWHNITGLTPFQGYKVATVDQALAQVGLDQRWDMFAPFPKTVSDRVEVIGTLTSGDVVDAWHLAPEPPPLDFNVARFRQIGNNRWRKSLERVLPRQPDDVTQALGRYVCERWQQTQGSALKRIDVYRVRSVTPSVKGDKTRQTVAQMRWSQSCEK